jgi:glycosyltransferase involved in cell wall biosynthesis
MKTVGFMISDQHLIPHGGIGQFCRSFTKLMNQQQCQIVLITDKKPSKKEFLKEINSTWNSFPNTPLSYANHRAIYGRFDEGVCYEKISNFQTAIDNAINMFDFDVIIANSHESLAALADHPIQCKKILYTHLYKQIYPNCKAQSAFLPQYHTFFQQFLYRNDIIVGTQSVHNKNKLNDMGINNVEVLPMPITETDLLSSSNHIEKFGALYIGRWEEGKNPKDYIKIIKKCNLPAKVMTNKKGKVKFEKAFIEAGINDYDIRASIIGQEKVDFIKSCKIYLNTSLIECFPNSVIETIGHMPIVTLDKVKVPWPSNFDNMLHTIDMKDLCLVDFLYNASFDDTKTLSYVQGLHNSVNQLWSKVI